MNTVATYATDFNRIINKLIRQIATIENTAELDRLRKRVLFVTNATPFLLLKSGSPYIWKYRDKLMNLYDKHTDSYDWSVFLECDYSDNYTPEDATDIDNIIQTLKRVFKSMKEDDKITTYDYVCDAVSIIAKYRILCKTSDM